MANKPNKTVETNSSVFDFLNSISDDVKRAECFKMLALMEKESGFSAKMWGAAIVGFGSYHYVYESGREGDAPLAGFSPRKDAIALYLSVDPYERQALLESLGKHKSAKSCIYIKRLEDICIAVLKKMIHTSVKRMKYKNP